MAPILGINEYSARQNSSEHVPISTLPEELRLPDGNPDYLRLILTSRVYDIIQETPISKATTLSSRFGYKILLKREDLTPVYSFKVRGAYNKIAHLPHEERWKGVIACSAGNHAQGVAYSAKHLGIPATIVMPTMTPSIKHSNVSRMGSQVVLHGNDFDEAKEECRRLEEKYGLTNIPPFDDPYVIAGQGTIGMEILRQVNTADLKAVFCCVGGGGLIAGVGVYLKRLLPDVKIIGVETLDANAMAESLSNGQRVTLNEVGLFADGAAVRVVGEETYRLCKEVVDEVIQVSTDEICAAIKDSFQDTRAIVEPAGALALAGLKKYATLNPPNPDDPHAKNTLVAVLSGANMDFDRLRFVTERARLGEGIEAFLSVTLPERPGAFWEMIQCILPNAISEFTYRYGDPKDAKVFISILISDENDLKSVLERLEAGGYPVEDLCDNELAKSHARYLIGGRAYVPSERVYRFEFPERPGALAKFLQTMRPGQNISLFHYRNQGGDVGRVLVGLQGEEEGLKEFVNELGYPFVDETENPVVSGYLRRDESK